MDEILQRLIQFRTQKEPNRSKFAEAISFEENKLTKIELGKRKLSFDLMALIAKEYEDFNFDWLITGRGAMLLPEDGIIIDELEYEELKNAKLLVKDQEALIGTLRANILVLKKQIEVMEGKKKKESNSSSQDKKTG